MKKLKGLILGISSIFLISGCGDGGNLEVLPEGERIFFLLSYTTEQDSSGEDKKVFEGIENVLYDCGSGERLTSRNGSFKFEEGEDCKFYNLDNKMSLSDKGNELFIKDEIKKGSSNIIYTCISGIVNETDNDGRFIFDPTYKDKEIIGDKCEFLLSDIY